MLPALQLTWRWPARFLVCPPCALRPAPCLGCRVLPNCLPFRPACRPAVVLSYLFGGLATLLTAACFAELAVEFPVSGGPFSYIMVGPTALR